MQKKPTATRLKHLFTNKLPLTFIVYIWKESPDIAEMFLTDLLDSHIVCEPFHNDGVRNPLYALYEFMSNPKDTHGWSLSLWILFLSKTWNSYVLYAEGKKQIKAPESFSRESLEVEAGVRLPSKGKDMDKYRAFKIEDVKILGTPAAKGIKHIR